MGDLPGIRYELVLDRDLTLGGYIRVAKTNTGVTISFYQLKSITTLNVHIHDECRLCCRQLNHDESSMVPELFPNMIQVMFVLLFITFIGTLSPFFPV